ncbi:DUF1294 domain-containing protein [Halobacillus yeomjeoni]|uniref:DUF1294 domain-containing protein n=1 Tax=Halobacillus yeomjeoni TaxID=311194 RepID=UPI001CD74680|nr:DUF1294 domain-containing protein [Halobacillus yeomjeoni]MCA0982525.1 DUF1294 domain-containing protein [Halobacillus yeomjeoni]
MEFVLIILLSYFFVINSLLYILMWSDKRKARKESWRVKEKTLWTSAVLGGAPGGWMAMKVYKHKTRHRSFRFGFPALAIVYLAGIVYLLAKFYL